MQLKTQDIGGIITAIQFNEIVESMETKFKSSILENGTNIPRKEQDFRSVENVNILYYTLPYFFRIISQWSHS